MCSAVPSRTLRQLLEEVEEICEREAAARAAAQVNGAVSSARKAARETLADSLNLSVRRLRQAGGIDEFLTTLAAAAAAFCNCAALFSVSTNIVRGEKVRGRAGEAREEQFRALRFPISRAAAFQSAIESGDPVVALGSPAELSPELSAFFAATGSDRVHLFPVARDSVSAVLCAAGEVEISPLELLAQAAGAFWPEPPAVSASLVSIQAAAPPLPGQETLHLRARRFARVCVAEMRLYRGDDVKQGRAHADLYSRLKESIDTGRETFQRYFVSADPAMIDYLHQEMVHTLANDNAELLGRDYPGPLA